MNAICWYFTRDDFFLRQKKCLQKYVLGINATFGWAPLFYDTVKDILYNGQLCSTGLAIPVYDTNSTTTRPKGMCVNITMVYTDQGTYTNPVTDVPRCLSSNKGSYCNYYYDNSNSFKTRCFCGADGSIGYCPLPNKEALSNFTNLESLILGNSTNCHTNDRNNLKAHLECGIGSGTPLESFI
jgi:hypothetical protein